MSDELPRHALDRLMDVAREDDVSGWRERFRLVRELGRGGMGVVWEAWDEELGRTVALKVMSDHVAATPDSRGRFEREALTAARLTHPGIAAVFDAWDDAIAMQLVRGITLADRARPTDVRDCARIMRDAARAVHYAHEHGIVHRDIKPANLMLEDERVVVTDFGLAKTAGDASMSLTGGIVGTPSYMSPEQASGNGRFAGPTTDVWGLGATLYFLLTGTAPFTGASAVEVVRKVCEDEPSKTRVDRDLDLVVATAMERDVARRYATAADLASDLDRWLEKRPVLARPPSRAYRLSKFVRRRKAAVAVVGAFVLAAVITAVVVVQQRARQEAAGQALELGRLVDAVIDDWTQQRLAGNVEDGRARLTEGIDRCRGFLERHGDVADVHFLLGRLLEAHGRLDEARRAFDRALELDADFVEARLHRGLLIAGRLAERAVSGEVVTPVDRMRESAAADFDIALADLEAAHAHAGRVRRVDALHVEAEIERLAGDRNAARRAYLAVLDLEHRVAVELALLRLDLEEGKNDEAWMRAMTALDIERGLGRAYAARRLGFAPTREPTGPTVVDVGTESTFVAVATPYGSGDAVAYASRSMAAVRRAVEHRRSGQGLEAEAAWTEAVADLETALVLERDLASARINVVAARIELARTRAALGRRQAANEILETLVSTLGREPAAGEHEAVARNRTIAVRLLDASR